MEKNIKYLSIVSPIKIADVLKMMVSEEKTGVIPALELVNENEEEEIIEDKSEVLNFDFAGYAILHDNKIVDYLTKDESIAFNFIKNEIKQASIVVKLDDDNENNNSGNNESNKSSENNITLGVTDASTTIDFKFSDNALKKIIINVKVRTNLESISFKEKIFTDQEITMIENKESEYIKNQLENVIRKGQNMQIDFFNFMEELKRKHPYKYEEVKENWKNIWPYIEVEVNVNSQIERRYDLLKTGAN